MTDEYQLTTPDEVAQILGVAQDLVKAKIGDRLVSQIQDFIALSPLVFVATHGRDGRVDVSPKGDPAGFVHVVDETTLAVPDRKGNNLADSLLNVIDTGRIGMIFVVPGKRETLRVNGRAIVTRDPALLERLSVGDKPALLCTKVTVEECFFHCGKAMIRSKAWQPDTWGDASDALMTEQLAVAIGDAAFAPAVSEALEADYVENLY